jgi:hypothetical protein
MEIGRMKQKDQDQEEEDGCTGARMTKQEPLVPLKPFLLFRAEEPPIT